MGVLFPASITRGKNNNIGMRSMPAGIIPSGKGQVDLAETDENGNENERGNENENENENGKGREYSTFCGIGRALLLP